MISCCRARRRRRTARRARRPTRSCQCSCQCSSAVLLSVLLPPLVAVLGPEAGAAPLVRIRDTAPLRHAHLDALGDFDEPGVVLELGDDAVDARRRHHLVADLGLANQRLLLAHALLLRTDQEDVHEPKGDGKKKKCAHGEGSREFGDGALSRLVRGSTSITSPEQPQRSQVALASARKASNAPCSIDARMRSTNRSSQPRLCRVSRRRAVGSSVVSRWRR